MNIECVIEIMKEKGHVKCYTYGYDTMPMFKRLKSLRGHELGEKFLEAFKNSKEYIFTEINSPCTEIEFVKKSEIKEWLQQDKFQNFTEQEIIWQCSHLDFEFKKFIEDMDFTWKYNSFRDTVTITNGKLVKIEKEYEKAKQKEALDLLDKIL